MHHRLTRLLFHAKKTFSLRVRIIFGVLLPLFTLWFFAQFVLAEREANIYIFPSSVTADSWEHHEVSLEQDLSLDAELVDFTKENSARVFYGQQSATGTDATSTEETREVEQPSPATDPTNVLDIPAAESPTIPPPQISPEASSTNEIPQLPNPFIPSGESIPTPPVNSNDTPEGGAPTQSGIERKLEEFLTRIWKPEPVLALEVPTSTEETTETESVPPLPDPFVPGGGSLLSVPDVSQGGNQEAPPPILPNTIDVVIATTSSTDGSRAENADTEATSSSVLPSVESSDPYTVALCTTLGKTCHILEYTGFGLGDALDKNPLLGATLELSLAGRGALTSGAYDRVIVRAYHGGHWQFLGATELLGEVSNGKRGGYLKYELPDIGEWGDLADLKVVVEYDRVSAEDASAYVDGIWINARYANDALDDASPEDVALAGRNLRSMLSAKDAEARKARRDFLTIPGGTQLSFVNQQTYEGAALTVKTDQTVYPALGEGRTYFNVTNESADPQVVRLQFHFPVEGASVRSLARFTHNVPYKVGELKYDDIGYFCDASWEAGTSTGTFYCGATDEVRSCDRLNDDKTNCITLGARVGLTEGTAYRDGWEESTLRPGTIVDDGGLFAKAIDLLLNQLPPDIMPSTVEPVAHLADSVLLLPGQTMYFRADIAVPLNGRGDFYVEAAAESGAYGLVHAGWDGSWNYRSEISLDNARISAEDSFAVPVSLEQAPAGFWQHVASDGSDLRFVDEQTGTELPYWLATFDRDKHSGSLWVRVNGKSDEASTSIAMYYGFATTTSRSQPAAPFRSDELLPRGIIFGGSQSDMTLHVIALDNNTRVRTANKPEVVLKLGESALFDGMKPGEVVYADGPITASVEAPGANALYVPSGYEGNSFVLPGIGMTSTLSLGILGPDVTHALLDLPSGQEAIDPVEGSIVGREVSLSDSVPLGATHDVVAVLGGSGESMPTPLYPLTTEDIYGFQVGKSYVGIAEDATAFTSLCGGETRKSVDGRREGSVVLLSHCASGDGLLSDAVRITDANHPVGLIDVLDNDLTNALPASEFASAYISPSDAVGVSVLCRGEDGPMDIGVFDLLGGLLASSTCEGRGVYPGYTFMRAPKGTFSAGFTLRPLSSGSLHTFLAGIIPSVKENVAGDIHHAVVPLSAPSLSRVSGAFHPAFTIGTEEFVVPGEHRKLDLDPEGNEKDHLDVLLSKNREFSIHQLPSFKFQYKRQANGLLQGVRDVLGVQPFTIARVILQHATLGDIPVNYDVTYGDNNEWSLSLNDVDGAVRPGKYTLHIEIEEGGESYVDEYDFYWGVLAINFNKSVFTPGEKVDISIGALSNNGNTICDARLKMWIVDTEGAESEVPVTSSGLCNGNNVVDVPDYTASHDLSMATGTYKVKLVRFDQEDNIASQIADSFEVRESVPYVVERVGPTRIYPLAHYPMKIHVETKEAFRGNIVERIPGDFVVIDRGNADLEWGDTEHTFITATWPVNLPAGGSIDLEYKFDAPDRSPYLFLLGPVALEDENGDAVFTELREWQIASDAAGKMILFWDKQDGGTAPSGWTCISCSAGQDFFERLPYGSSTYGTVGGGSATNTHTVGATVFQSAQAGVTENSTVNTLAAFTDHTHTLTPSAGATSSYPLSRSLRVIQSNSAGEPVSIPTGAVAVFDVASSSLPSTWFRYSAGDGYYPYGANTIGTATGSNTHLHTITGSTSVGVSSLPRRSRTGGTQATPLPAPENHTHQLTATNTALVSNEPPYLEVLLARLSATSTATNTMITMWDNDPPDGWLRVSSAGGTFDGKFIKASTTYGATGGAADHTHADIVGATTGAASANTPARTGASASPNTHTHAVDLTGFTTDSHLPPYWDVIFAKRFSGVTFYTQDSYRIYNNANVLDPTDPWPPGASDYGESEPIVVPGDSVKPTDKIRLRMNLFVTNSTSTVGADSFKLQYAASNDCPNALNWDDVSASASSTAKWRGFDNTLVANNATITSMLLSSSTIAEAYVEQNSSTTTLNEVGIGGVGEWDWVVQDNLADANTSYCFRMVKRDGTPLDTYITYPEILTNASPSQTVESAPFSFEKVGTTTPEFQFFSTDGESNDLDYLIQIDTSATFTSPLVDKDSLSEPELFENIINPTNKAPFFSGDTIQFSPASALTNGTTYWWRVRAKDTNGSNAWGPWSSGQSLTIDTTVATSTWFQTTRDQFQLDDLVGTNASASDRIMLNVGSTTGTTTSGAIDFSLATIGTVWGSLSWNDVETVGDIKYHLEYLTSTSSWALIPDADLSGNGAGFDASPVSLLSVDATTYSTIRIRADFTDIGGTPTLNDWTLTWGFNVVTPTLYTPFDNQKVATKTPSFEFMTTDPQGDDIYYEFQWSTTSSFTSSSTRNSQASSTAFVDITPPISTNPFDSGHRIRFTLADTDTLASSTTYFWRVRGKDVNGANNFSFWSPVRSFTVDTGITVPTWYQTGNDQFETDTLSSMYTFSNGSTTVATTTNEVMLAYGEGSIQTPRYRIWNGTSLGSELSALSVGAAIQWVVMKASPLLGQYIMGTLGSDRDVNWQVYESGSWGNQYESAISSPSLTRRSFDVAYETVSGRAVAVSCEGPDPDYRIWSGSAWAATGTIDLSFSTNCEWVRLASNPTSNEIIGIFRNTGSRYEAQVWNGTTSSWGNSTVLGSMSEVNHEGMAVEYEASGQQALVVTSNAGNANFVSKSWSATNTTWNGTTTTAIGDDFEWGNLRRNTTNDNMALCYVDQDSDVGVMRWNGSAWNTFVTATDELDAAAIGKEGRPIDCQYETAFGHTNWIMAVYSDLTNTRYDYFSGTAWQNERTSGTTTNVTESFTDQLVRTSASGTMTALYYDHVGLDIIFAALTGSSTWTDIQNIEPSPSVLATPFGEPFYMAPKNPVSIGTIVSSPIDFDDGVAPAWKRILWDVTKPGVSTFTMQVEYQDQTTGVWSLVPDVDLPGNSSGTSTSPITISTLDTNTYNVLRLKGTATCISGNCPTLNDWTLEWASGIQLSGVAREHDLTTNVTSGTVAVAVNGTLQSGKTGTIVNGNWSIDNVTVFPGNTVTVFVDGANDFNEAVGIAKYTGPGDAGGMRLAERWVTLGSASTTDQSLSLTDIGKYDNSISADEDIFFDVTAGGDYSNCVTGVCLDSSIDVYSNTFRPSTSTPKTINTWDMRNDAYFYGDANTIKVSGSWRNLGGFTSNASTVIFNGTSSTRTIDSTGAATSTFFNVTFGESGNVATWNLSSAFVATGTVAMSFGTTSQGASDITLQGDLTIGAGALFVKGAATTTFSGSTAKTWTDSSSGQDLGTVVINGTAKTVTLGSNVRATDVTIGADDTLNAGGANTLTVLGNWNNTGTFTAQTGTVAFAATTAGKTINQGLSSFYNVAFTGVGGGWTWQNTNATTTNDLTISAAGTTTLPSGTLAIGGSFNNTAGVFAHNSGVVRFTSTAGGKTVRANGSDWNDIIFAGSGGAWTMSDTNATTTGTLFVTAGTPTLPSGTLAIGNTFDAQGGAFVANSGTVRMNSALLGRTIHLSGSSLANFFVAGNGTFTIAETNATATGDVIFAAGTTTFPTANFAIGGSLTSPLGAFTAGVSTVHFNPSSGTKTVNPGASTFGNVNISANALATVNITAHATATSAFTLISGTFIQATSTSLAVGGTFTNQTGGASTTWTGSTLSLYSGTSYTLNGKSTGGDAYATMRLASGNNIRMWNSSVDTYQLTTTSSMYSQDDGGVDGTLLIAGNYIRGSGTDYWSYATDFDGTALGVSSRQANVRFAPNATSSFTTGATLQILGTTTGTTTIDRETSGSFAVTLASTTLNAEYYQFRNMNARGLDISGSSTITSLSFGDFEVAAAGGSGITIASTTITNNSGLQIFSVRFATTTGIAAFNVTEEGTPVPGTGYIRFKQHYGNIAGEDFDNDPGGNPGYVRWDDSLFVISISGTVYADAGATPMGAPTCNDVTPNVRVKVNGQGNFASFCASADGTFTVPGVTFVGDTVMTVYLDTGATTQRKAVFITKSAAGDLSNIRLYQDRVIVSHEDITPITIADMNAYDGGDDPDISFTAATSGTHTLSVNPETEFWVWTGKTFVPGGNITLNSGGSGNNWDGSFHIDNNAVFTAAGTESHSVGGRWTADAGATFTAASSTFTFTATTSGKTITALAAITFWNTIFNGSGGGWAVNQIVNVGNDLTVTAGTLSGANSVNVSGTNVTGNGSIALTGGTFTMQNGGTFGGATDWSFNNLTFGNGSLATTSKTGSSTITVAGVLTNSALQVLRAGNPSAWNLTGGGTPFVQSGTFDPESSIFRYSGTSATNITAGPYHKLYLAPSGSGGPTYTLGAGTFTIGNNFTLGDGANTATVTATTNDPTLTLLGDVFINATTTFIASDSGVLNASRSWINQGLFTHSNGLVNFVATTTGHSITTASSTFYDVNFNGAAGGWTITGNATASRYFILASAAQFTMASGTTLEVGGAFTNGVGGSATTWTGSTLYMNTASTSVLNVKTAGDDHYDALQIGANSAISMWNSVATTTVVSSSGSLYSQNHDAVSGSLYIWGAYARSSGTDYWDYGTDFDGTALGSPRQVNVRFASATTMTISGSGALEAVGTSTASTTLDVQALGTYAMNISGGSTTMQYLNIRGISANGLNFTGTPVVNKIDDTNFLLEIAGGSMITVAGGTIDANPLKIFSRNYFSTSTGILTGANVTATGLSTSIWRFAGTPSSYGNYAGEAYDSDPGGDPGYIVWDDSANNITISGNVYSDEGNTPIGGSVCNGVTQNVRLRVQGGGAYTSACNASTGAFSISTIVFNPGDTLTLYLDTNSTTSAANISVDPVTNINDMHLYRDRVIVRHEQGNPMTIAAMDLYDGNQDADIPFAASLGSPNSLSVRANTKLIVWMNKTFAPGGNVTVHANAGSGIDGSAELYATSTWSAAGTETHTLGGQFLAQSGASVSPGNSTFIFNATTTGKSIAASSSLTFYNLTFSGIAGAWNIGGVGTSSNDVSITAGTVTLPSGAMAIGGTFDTNGGSFLHNSGTLRFTSTASGKNIRSSGSEFNAVEFRGVGGGWTFLDANATTTAGVLVATGTAVLPTGVLAVGTDFDNQGGTVSANGGTLKMTATSTGRIVRTGGSSLAGFMVQNSGDFTFLDANATATGDVIFVTGSSTLPSANFVIGGSFIATGTIAVGTSTITFNPVSGIKNVTWGTSTLYNVNVQGGNTATTSIVAHATTTNVFTLTSGNFVQASGTSLAIGGVFTNLRGGASTTWTGSTLSLYSGTSYTMNTKTLGGDAYGILRLAANNNIRSWDSSAVAYQIPANSSFYSQDHAGVSGSLNIYGTYARTSGTDYWSYATDFDGTALGGSSRQANVRFDSGATAAFTTNSSLQILGTGSASTTIDRISSGSYGLSVTDATINASYYQFRNLDTTGLNLAGTTTITNLGNGDFELATAGGSMLSIASTTIDQNASAQYSQVRFATTTAIMGANVSRIGTTTNAITWANEYGNMATELRDNDGNDECGSIRFTDSSCLISDQKSYRWRNDDGGEGALASEWYDQNWTRRQRVRITNNSTSTVTNAQVKMNIPYDADMQNDFDDLRFTDSSGTTSIPYWIETYVTSGSSTVWVKVPTLTTSAITDIFMYYGNGSVSSAGSGTSTFKFFDDFEDNNITEYSGDTSLFSNSTSFNYERSYGLAASTGNTGSQNTSGIGQVSAGVGRDTTFRFFQYVDMSTGGGDEPCFLFAIQSPITAHQNYGICLSPFGADKVSIVKNAAYNGRNDGATILATTSVTYSTGWYEASVDWLSNNQISVTVYDSVGAVFATTSVTDSTWTTGGVGFTFWGMHGGWDIPEAREYIKYTPSINFGLEQQDSGATWKATENTLILNQTPAQNVRLRTTIRNSGAPLTNQNFRLQVAAKLSSPNCESVPSGNYTDIAPNGSCGTSPACMSASSQFTDKASTTQLLSIPSGQTFTNGQIIENTSIETGAIDLPSSTFTEVEYNFQMVSAYAVQNAYCFRSTNGGTPLDNYTKVAEMTVLHPPVIANLTFNGNNNIALTEGTTTTIVATATISDLNGYADIIAASSTFYRSSVSGGRLCASDDNNCYQIGTPACLLSNCSGNSCDVSCSASMRYFADPTDFGSIFAADNWQGVISTWDTSNSYDMSSSSQELLTLRAFNASSTINYGNVDVGGDTGSSDATTTVNNTGNVLLNLDIGGDPLTAGASSISYDKQKYSTSTFNYSGCTTCNVLSASTSPTFFPIAVTKPTTTYAFFRDIYWGIAVPLGTAATTHSGVNYFTAQ